MDLGIDNTQMGGEVPTHLGSLWVGFGYKWLGLKKYYKKIRIWAF